MPQRTRTVTRSLQEGVEVRIAPYNDQFTASYPRFVDTCTDVTGNRAGDNRLTIDHRGLSGSCLDGNFPGSPYYWSNWPTNYWYTYHMRYPDVFHPSQAEMVTSLLAKTNPSRVSTNVPAFIAELKDFPMMIRHAGRLLHNLKNRPSGLNKGKEAAASYIAYSFGWAPLVKDLLAMCNFAENVAARKKELERLHSKGGLKRRMTLSSYSNSVRSRWTLQTNDQTCRPFVDSTVTSKVWGTIRWMPDSLPPKSLGDLATSAFYGLNFQNAPAALWELLPWSWLIDYFGNVGQYIGAHNNVVGAHPERVNLMIHSKWTQTHDGEVYSSEPRLALSPGRAYAERKERWPKTDPTPSLHFGLPFLSVRQLAILSSLAVVRFSR